MARRIALLLVAGAAATRPNEQPACSERTCPAPVLLQTQRSVERTDEAEAAVPPLPPPFVAPPEAEAEAAAKAGAMPRRPLLAQLVAGATAYQDREWENYLAVKALRQQGFRCPGGEYFAANSLALEFDCRLWKAAQLHSQDMGQRNYFSHTSPSGTDPFDRSSAQGLGTFNENIAAGNKDSPAAMEQWKKSDGHCTNMMKATHNRFGVGYAYAASSTYKHYWTQLFAQSSGSVDTSCYQSGGGVTTAPPSTGTCENTNPNCDSWAQAGYCSTSSKYYSYMQQKCGLACGFCGGTVTTQPPSSGTCENTNPNCDSWAQIGYCSPSSKYYYYMQSKCGKACGFCGSTGGPGGGGSCQNTNPNCQSWSQIGYWSPSSQYYSFMRSTCAKACRFCGSGGAPGGGGSCQNTNPNCQSWSQIGYCSPSSQYYSFMQSKCRQACGFCR
mmetsp:Transcript_74597/g.215564  ORF Transcript_74597/g.215564 Transcript_74597/m.215564 type:complete len:442 (+) Transcript_74597:74-1399(+)